MFIYRRKILPKIWRVSSNSAGVPGRVLLESIKHLFVLLIFSTKVRHPHTANPRCDGMRMLTVIIPFLPSLPRLPTACCSGSVCGNQQVTYSDCMLASHN